MNGILQNLNSNTEPIKKLSGFFQQNSLCLRELTPGTLKLIPPEYRFPALISDYEAMKDMLYGDIPSFDTIIKAVSQLETEINSL